MAPLRTLKLPILTDDVLRFFEENGIISEEDFLVRDTYALAATAECQNNSEALKQAIAEILLTLESQHGQWLNGAELLENFNAYRHVLPTGCEGVDSVLGGGLLEGTLTELVGPSASGKTQICFHAAAQIASYWEAAAIYIDSSNSFSSKRIVDILNVQKKSSISMTQPSNIQTTMKRIQHLYVYDIFSLLRMLNEIESTFCSKGNRGRCSIRLLVVDSVSSLLTPILGGSSLQGYSLMTSLGVLLKKLAWEYNVAVLLTNGLVIEESGMLKPALGESWKTVPHVRLLLSKHPANKLCEVFLLRHTSRVCGQKSSFLLG